MKYCAFLIVLLINSRYLAVAQNIPLYKDSGKIYENWKYYVDDSNSIKISSSRGIINFGVNFQAAAELDTVENTIWLKKEMEYPPIDEIDYGFENISGGWKLYSLNGNLLNDSIFDYPASFFDKLAIVKISSRMGVIDSDGKFLIHCVYDSIIQCYNNFFIVKSNGKFGFYSSDFKMFVPPRFENISTFIGNRAFILSNDTIGIVDEKGRVIKDIQSVLGTDTNILDYLNLYDNKESISESYYGYYGSDPIVENIDIVLEIKNSKSRNFIVNEIVLWKLRDLLINNGLNVQLRPYLNYNNYYDPSSLYSADTFKYWLPEPAFEFYLMEYEADISYCDSQFTSYILSKNSVFENTRGYSEKYPELEFKHYELSKGDLKSILPNEFFISNHQSELKSMLYVKYINYEDTINFNKLEIENIILSNLYNFSVGKDELIFRFKEVSYDGLDMVFEIDYEDIIHLISPDSYLYKIAMNSIKN